MVLFLLMRNVGPTPHIVLSLSVAQGGLLCVFSLVSISVRGLVPLHNACSYGHYEVAELLVKVIHLIHRMFWL